MGLEPTAFWMATRRSTTELLPRNLEQTARIELASTDWKSEAQPIYHTCMRII
jgi:hypothetical protein